ncbi:Hemolysin, contains CBS domains [Raineyella antarctica]|uniref:Hemolysin, contains CBS domains n=1 Tax=Raineyella antarctica TaxID=1577474 RepID=A0A1G6GHD3_9ACTN|nr:hemolysin family protein [Raineyella antarctica]SDB81243.1 Hemolysin, contains CBS domains [Raineyella antarctica]
MLTAWILLAVLLVLIVANALFVGVEFAFLTVNRHQVRAAEEAGDGRAGALERALKKTSSNLSGAQLGITVSSLLTGFLIGPSLGLLLAEVLDLAGVARDAAIGVATVVAFALVTFGQMVFGELVPKNWAIAEPMRVARLVVYPQRIFMALFGWLVRILNGAANGVLKLLGFTPTEEIANARTAEELQALVSRSGAEGTLAPETAELVARSIEFGERTAADVMRPRPQVTFLHEHTVQELIDTAAATGHSRFPVAGETVDDVVGIVHFKHAFAVPYEERTTRTVREIAVPATYVSESMTLDPLLRELRRPGLQMAVVVDEYGGTAGIVTLEDLIEEIIGAVDDEHDETVAPYLRRQDGGISVSGLLRPDELGDIMDLELPEGAESDTLGGLVTEKLDRLPKAGDTVRLTAVDHLHRDEDNLPTSTEIILKVVRMDGHRADRIVVRRTDGHRAVHEGGAR